MKKVKKQAEFRALTTNQKELTEQRNDLVLEMEQIVQTAQAETRSLTEDENNRYTEIRAEIKNLDTTLEAIEFTRTLENTNVTKKNKEAEQRALDEENFINYIKGEKRALDVSNNGGIIPTSIADRIIEKVKELSPIYKMATIYNVKGDLVFPVYDETTPIQAQYVEDMQELTEQTGKFTTVKLTNFIVGCLAKVSESLVNRTDFDLVSYVIQKVAQAIADFLERELVVGTSGKMAGVLSAEQGITLQSATVITGDDLIDLQDSIPDIYQAKACWIMHKNTRRAIRKLKDADGNYLLQKDLTMPFGYSLLGKPVYISESCPQLAAGKKVIAYGDMSGLYVKLTKNVDIKVLQEKYATQHAIGVVGYVEADSKIVEPQKLAVMTMATA